MSAKPIILPNFREAPTLRKGVDFVTVMDGDRIVRSMKGNTFKKIPVFPDANARVEHYISTGAQLPIGTYILTSPITITKPSARLNLHEAATIVTPPLTEGIKIAAPNVTLSGGTIKGSWDMGRFMTPTERDDNHNGEKLVSVRGGHAFGLTIENMLFKRSRGYGLAIFSEDHNGPLDQYGISIRSCVFQENYNHMWLRDYYEKYEYPIRGLFMDNILFDVTGSPPSGVVGHAEHGGNAINGNCPITDATFSNLIFRRIGRMCVEIYMHTNTQSQTFYCDNLLFKNCDFGAPAYRTYSGSNCWNTIIDQCRFESNNPGGYLEMVGWNVNTLFTNNTVIGEGILSPSGHGEFVVTNNRFFDRTGQSPEGGAIMMLAGRFIPSPPVIFEPTRICIKDNQYFYTNTFPAGWRREVVDFRYSDPAILELCEFDNPLPTEVRGGWPEPLFSVIPFTQA
jgi:hypothetical protein